MNNILRQDADKIISNCIKAVQPNLAVKRALEKQNFTGNVYLVSIGKAAWQMASAASDYLNDKITKGIIITKYNHVMGEIKDCHCYEAGHPVPDQNSFNAAQKAIELVNNLTQSDTVLFLVSGGGSALFESPEISSKELQDITNQLLASGADIVEMNTIRKRLSKVKGGKFAQICAPAKVYSIVLSDILGDPLDMIASGPAYPDSTTANQAMAIVKKYNLSLSQEALGYLLVETPKELPNAVSEITGSVKQLCNAAAKTCEELGYKPVLLTDQLCCQAKEAGGMLASILKTYSQLGENIAFLAGGETVVKLTGKGLGGRNQELALAAAPGISKIKGTAVFSVGSDGTDGPTDAAGGYVDSETYNTLTGKGLNVFDVLNENDAYHALLACDGLITTGPTGTNVNDIAVALLKVK